METANRVSEIRILCYSSLYLPVSMALLPVNLYILPFYAELGIPLYAMSVIIFAARLSDAITDPLMGVLCDRTKTPWGRRKPWILIGTPLLMLALYKLFLPPAAPLFGISRPGLSRSTWLTRLSRCPITRGALRCRVTTSNARTSAAVESNFTLPVMSLLICFHSSQRSSFTWRLPRVTSIKWQPNSPASSSALWRCGRATLTSFSVGSTPSS